MTHIPAGDSRERFPCQTVSHDVSRGWKTYYHDVIHGGALKTRHILFCFDDDMKRNYFNVLTQFNNSEEHI